MRNFIVLFIFFSSIPFSFSVFNKFVFFKWYKIIAERLINFLLNLFLYFVFIICIKFFDDQYDFFYHVSSSLFYTNSFFGGLVILFSIISVILFFIFGPLSRKTTGFYFFLRKKRSILYVFLRHRVEIKYFFLKTYSFLFNLCTNFPIFVIYSSLTIPLLGVGRVNSRDFIDCKLLNDAIFAAVTNLMAGCIVDIYISKYMKVNNVNRRR